ncbi:MAG: hypothetical protein K2O42_01855 [Oscillospiraceae bacterium]|nr:hypothetical protein [Oscillospiraceae bacterium]
MQKYLKKCAVWIALCLASMQAAYVPVNADYARSVDLPDFSYLGATESLSAKETQQIAANIYQGIANHDDGIIIDIGIKNYNLDKIQEVLKIYRTVISTWDIGILTSRLTVTYQVSNTGLIKIKPNYLENDDNYEKIYHDVMQKIDEIISGVDVTWSDAEKALYLHDYLAVNYDYEYTDYTDPVNTELKHTAYGMLEKNSAVCEGYAWLYNILLQRVGVTSAMVESQALSHAWNLLYIDHAWYHVDVTWDDVYDQHAGLVYHKNFLKSNEALTENSHDSDDWVLTTGQSVFELPVSDFYNNGFWNHCNSAILYYQNQWFAIHCDADQDETTAWFDLCDFDAKTGNAEITHINSLDAKWARWYVFDKENYYYAGTYITPVVVNDILYYTTPTDVFAWKDGGVVWLFGLDEKQKQEGYIYGMYAKENKLYYQVSISATDEPELYSYELWEEAPEELSSIASTSATTTSTTTASTSATTISTTASTSATTISTTASTSATTISTTASTTSTTITSTTTSTTTTSTTTSTTTTSTACTTTAESISTILYGDIDNDGMLSVQDLILLRKYLLCKTSFTKEEFLHADVLQDQIVNIYDFVILKKILLESQK